MRALLCTLRLQIKTRRILEIQHIPLPKMSLKKSKCFPVLIYSWSKNKAERVYPAYLLFGKTQTVLYSSSVTLTRLTKIYNISMFICENI
jgi:hypothetical protein